VSRENEITSRRTDTRKDEIDGLSSLFFQYANDLSQAPGRSCLTRFSIWGKFLVRIERGMSDIELSENDSDFTTEHLSYLLEMKTHIKKRYT